MSDFRNLKVYQLARLTNKEVFGLVKDKKVDRYVRDQLSRASMSISLNIAEGAARFSQKDKRNFYVIARASASECIALADILEDLHLLSFQQAESLRQRFEELSKMLMGLVRAIDSAA